MKARTAIMLFCLLFSSICAQEDEEIVIPGYLGKHFIVGYANNFNPAFFNPSANSNPRKENLSLNTTHEFHIDYTGTERSNVCFMFQYLKTGATYQPITTYETSNITGGPIVEHYYYEGSKPYQITTFCYGVGFKLFGRGRLAPVGKYMKMDFIVYSSKLIYDETNFSSYNFDSGVKLYNQTVGKGEYTAKTFGFGLTIGNQHALYDFLVIDYGVRLALLPVSASLALHSTGQEKYVSTSFNEYPVFCRQLTNERLFGHQFLNVHIGIGLLAF